MGFDHRTIRQVESASEVIERMTRSRESAIATATRGLADLSAARQIPRVLDAMNGESSMAKAALGLTDINKMGLMSTGIKEATRVFNSPAYDSLTQGLVSNKLSQLNNLVSAFQAPSAFATFTGQLAELSATQHALSNTSWKPVLMRWAMPRESYFVSKLPDIQRTLYFSIRPELLTVVEQIHRMQNPISDSTFVRWLSTPSGLDLGLDFELEPEFEIPLTDEAPSVEPRSTTTLPAPFGFDTRTRAGRDLPSVGKELVVWVAGHPWVVRIVGAAVYAPAGGMVGYEMGGSFGAAVGGVVSAFGPIATEYVVVTAQRRRNS